MNKQERDALILKLHNHGQMTMTQIADLFGINKSTVSRVIAQSIPQFIVSCSDKDVDVLEQQARHSATVAKANEQTTTFLETAEAFRDLFYERVKDDEAEETGTQGAE